MISIVVCGFHYMIWPKSAQATNALQISASGLRTFGANDSILLQRPAGPPAPPGMSLNSLETGPLTRVPTISPLLLSKTHAVSSNLLALVFDQVSRRRVA